MTDDQITSIRRARHDARNGLSAVINDAMGAEAGVNDALGFVFTILAGQSGYTPEEQSQRLTEAAVVIGDLPSRMRAAADQVASDPRINALVEMLRQAAAAATDRDFDAWQAQKAAAGEGALPALDGQGFVTPDTQIGDLLAAMLANDSA
ncbi:hypothetical protein DVS28_b0528 (plasmid) [Euzebya pacifica]|uniref:Uncharacterized protein n=1 Tax=Euzebya pacifica TaxID=1608957 RepID=A0A346Y721_9ACTN|nr:hypothetical protein [Euzebya pacifica]AXV10268.1 hypothetical protein DVS28_b0528 [Euzebya pacifica]